MHKMSISCTPSTAVYKRLKSTRMAFYKIENGNGECVKVTTTRP